MNVSGSFTDKYCFLAVHDDVGYPHQVGCIDRIFRQVGLEVDSVWNLVGQCHRWFYVVGFRRANR